MQVKCTSCGASQNITESQNCDYCGNLIELELAKSNYQSSINGEYGNLLSMAETAIDATNWEEALNYFNRVLEKDITNSDAWLGKGIAIVYTSKIGDLKINEAIAYWKNAIKHATNSVAMSKRVAKEINQVVSKFYPTLENHFIQFKDLNNTYNELTGKFVILEKAQEFATQLDPESVTYCENGYNLCNRVIDIPERYAWADQGAAIANFVVGTINNNAYQKEDAKQARQKAKEREREIQSAKFSVIPLKEKYYNQIKTLNPNHEIVLAEEKLRLEKKNSLEEQKQRNELKKKFRKKYIVIYFLGPIAGVLLSILIIKNADVSKDVGGSLVFWSMLIGLLIAAVIVDRIVEGKISKELKK